MPHSPRVLVIDDSARILQSIMDLLQISADYEVLTAHSGYEALEKLTASLDQPDKQLDLILLDITMPGMGGIEVLRWIRNDARFAYTRVIMITARDDKQTVVEALSLGADDYITKPFHPRELLARVSSTLRTQSLEKRLQWQQNQLSMLNQLSNQLLSVLDPTAMFDVALGSVRQLFEIEAVAMFMASATRQYLRCQYAKSWGMTLTADDYAVLETTGPGIVVDAFCKAHIVVANEVESDTRFRPNEDAPASLSVTCMVAAPVYMHGRPMGVLTAYNKSDKQFNETDIDLFASLIGTMSLAFENAWHLHSIEQQKESLSNSRNKLQAIIDGIQNPIYTINTRWQITSLNARQASAAGNLSLTGERRFCYEALYQRSSPCEHCQVAILFAEQTPQNWSVQQPGADQTDAEWDVHAYPLPKFRDGDAAAVVVWQDRTEERRLERSLIQSAKLSAVGRLTAGIAHELNNPLTVISTGIELLRVDLSPDEETGQIIEWMGNATERVAQGIRGLLELGRQGQYVFREGDLNDSLQSALDLMKYQIHSVDIITAVDFDPNLPLISASWQHLKTAWVSFLLNARDALQETPGTRSIQMATKLSSDKNHAVVTIRDTGKGMSPEQLTHAFEPFFTTKASGKGVGLGLFTCKRIIDAHGGVIELNSLLEHGTTATIYLPVQR